MIERASRFSIVVLLLAAIVALVVSAGCGPESQLVPTPTPDIQAMVNAAVSQALGTPVAEPVGDPPEKEPAPKNTLDATQVPVRPGYCGRLCDEDFWDTADLTDVAGQLERGVDVRAKGSDGVAPLHYAVAYEQADVASLLLRHGADPNARTDAGLTPMEFASYGQPPNRDVFAALLDGGADPNIKLSGGFTALHHVVMGNYPGQRAIVEMLLDRGANPMVNNEAGYSALHFATGTGNLEVVKYLLDQGADITAIASDGSTLLHNAAANETPAIAGLLLERGADIAAKNNYGMSPLHTATESPDHAKPAVIAFLLDWGAEIDARDNAGATPLHYLAGFAFIPFESGEYVETDEAVAVLIDRGANILARTHEGETACDIVERQYSALQEPKDMLLSLLCPQTDDVPNPPTVSHGSIKQWTEPPSQIIDISAAYSVVLHTSAGTVTIELFPAEAPNTVNNFVFLSKEGFYENVIFHRTIEGFMIQGGDPTGAGGGGPG